MEKEMLLKESEISPFERKIASCARPFIKDALCQRFKLLEQNVLGDPAPILVLKSIRTEDAFEDFTFYHGRIAYAVAFNVIYRERSLLSIERRKSLESMCERYHLIPLTFKVIAQEKTVSGVGDGEEQVELEFKVGEENGGWGFFDPAIMETDARVMMLCAKQPAKDIPMSPWEIQAAACKVVRDEVTRGGGKILTSCDALGAIPSVVCEDADGTRRWIAVFGVTRPVEFNLPVAEILADDRMTQLREMTGHVATVLVYDPQVHTPQELCEVPDAGDELSASDIPVYRGHPFATLILGGIQMVSF